MTLWTPRHGAAIATTAVAWIFVAGAAALYGGSARPADTGAAVLGVQSLATPLVVSGLGLFIAWRRPASPIGWLMIGGAVAAAIAEFASDYREYAFAAVPPRLPFADAMVVAENATWSLYLPFLLLLFLLFPDGRLLSPRWRPVAWCAALTSPVFIVFALFWPEPDKTYGVRAPFAVSGGAAELIRSVAPAVIGAMLLLFVLSASGLVVRFRRSRGIEREQLKWLTYAAMLVVFAFLLSAGATSPWTNVFFGLSIYLFLVAIAVAILRYRLYDIDLLINRTLVYGGLSAVLAGTYFLAVLGLETVLRPFTAGSEVSVALSTLAVVALFTPLRRRLQAAVDERFYRQKYDAVRTLDAFSARLRDEVDLDAVRDDLLDAVGGTVQPTYVSVWLRERAP